MVPENWHTCSKKALQTYRALSLSGKGHGTPSLRLGIHQVGHTAEYEESDEKTEWPGFAEPEDDAVEPE